ncbi:hypothetical protein E1295_28440 [Nonomuraea mesophila]|uniref:Uncharacterized protein n=1 Tax=Nonomuraea mesophila TaxID=2530382 RepID=A0A4V2Z8W7_9ACTN|nr:hypothetical protein E1295_28440 [Nonomuraea mesophila]
MCARRVLVGAGARWGDVAAAPAPHELAITSGDSGRGVPGVHALQRSGWAPAAGSTPHCVRSRRPGRWATRNCCRRRRDQCVMCATSCHVAAIPGVQRA